MAPEVPSETLFFRILGPLLVEHNGEPVKIATRRQRALLTLLLMQVGKAVPAERLIDQLWQGAPPPQAAVTLRSYISYLRLALRVGGDAPVLVTRGQSYAIEVDPAAVDAVRLERLVESGRALAGRSDAEGALASFSSALRLWRGDPLADVADTEAAQSTIARIRQLRLAAEEGRFDALITLGRHLDALPALEAFVSENPLREHARAQLMRALYRAGRTPEALAVHREFRALLADELGIDPSPSLDALLQQILQQSAELDGPATFSARGGADKRPSRAGPAGVQPNIVGRRREIALLAACIDRLVDEDSGGLVLLAGEPGIGKTTMLLRLRDLADRREVRMYGGRSPAATGAPAFWPWTQAISSLAKAMDDQVLSHAASGRALAVTQVVDEVASRLGRRQDVVADDPHTARFLLYEALATFLEQAAQRRPLVIGLDDLHWADVPSLELLAHVVPRLSTSRVLLAAAYRDVLSERTPELDAVLATVSREHAVEELVLRGLSHQDVAGLAGAVSGSSVPDEVVTLLHERTGGNPFFIRQMAQLIAESSTSETAGDVTAAALPPGVRHVLNSRTRSLPLPVRQLLDVASVFGRDFEPAVVARAADVDIDTALDRLDVAVEHGFVEVRVAPFTGYRFVHGLVQESVYDSLAPGRALKLHARAADALEAAAAPIDQLAEQMWRAAELLGDERPLRHTLAAAEHATRLLAYEQAEFYLRRAMHLIRMAPYDPQTELGVLLNLFRLMATIRGWGTADAREVVQQARRLIDDAGGIHGDLVHLWFSLWMSLNSRNELETADEVALTLMQHVQETPDPVAAVAGHLMLAFRRFRQHDHWREGALELERAREAARTAPPDALAAFPEHLGVLVLLSQAETIAFLADPRAVSLDDEAIALAEQAGRPGPRAFAYTIASLNSAVLGEATRTQRLARVGREISTQYGLTFLARVADYAEAWAAATLGADPVEQATRIRSAIDSFRSSGDAPSEAHALLLLAEVLVLSGDIRQARECLQRVRRGPGPFAHVIVHYVDQKLAAWSSVDS